MHIAQLHVNYAKVNYDLQLKWAGFIILSHFFADIDECTMEYRCYSPYLACVNLPGSYDCDCLNGLFWNGSQCIEVVQNSINGNVTGAFHIVYNCQHAITLLLLYTGDSTLQIEPVLVASVVTVIVLIALFSLILVFAACKIKK